jgi:hypothetical protein
MAHALPTHNNARSDRVDTLFDRTEPPQHEWFLKNRNELVLLGETPSSRTSLPFTDNRDRIEFTYRVEVGADGGQLVKIGENAGNPWVKRGWIAAVVFVSLGIIGLGLRWVWGRRPHPVNAQ